MQTDARVRGIVGTDDKSSRVQRYVFKKYEGALEGQCHKYVANESVGSADLGEYLR